MADTNVSAPTFALDRFDLEDDRLVVEGRWFDVRGRRFVRPVLTTEDRRRAIAVLDHKPWVPEDGQPWVAAFRLTGVPAAGRLQVAPDLAIDLPTPGPRAGGGAPQPARVARVDDPSERAVEPPVAVVDEAAAGGPDAGGSAEASAAGRPASPEAAGALGEATGSGTVGDRGAADAGVAATASRTIGERDTPDARASARAASTAGKGDTRASATGAGTAGDPGTGPRERAADRESPRERRERDGRRSRAPEDWGAPEWTIGDRSDDAVEGRAAAVPTGRAAVDPPVAAAPPATEAGPSPESAPATRRFRPVDEPTPEAAPATRRARTAGEPPPGGAPATRRPRPAGEPSPEGAPATGRARPTSDLPPLPPAPDEEARNAAADRSRPRTDADEAGAEQAGAEAAAERDRAEAAERIAAEHAAAERARAEAAAEIRELRALLGRAQQALHELRAEHDRSVGALRDERDAALTEVERLRDADADVRRLREQMQESRAEIEVLGRLARQANERAAELERQRDVLARARERDVVRAAETGGEIEEGPVAPPRRAGAVPARGRRAAARERAESRQAAEPDAGTADDPEAPAGGARPDAEGTGARRPVDTPDSDARDASSDTPSDSSSRDDAPGAVAASPGPTRTRRTIQIGEPPPPGAVPMPPSVFQPPAGPPGSRTDWRLRSLSIIASLLFAAAILVLLIGVL